MDTAPQIPVVEYDALRNGAPGVAEAILEGFGRFGLVYISGHPLDFGEVLRLYDTFLEVLERPEQEKATWGGPQLWFQRGWTPPNTERAVIAQGKPDFKECFFAAPEPLDPRCRIAWPQLYADNVWPADAPEFEERTLAVGRALHAVGILLLRACEVALDLGPEEMVGLSRGGAHVTRLLKYLPLTPEQAARRPRVLWGEEHTDFNVLTLLPGGCFFRDRARGRPQERGGLYLRTPPTPEHPSGRRVGGQPPEGCLVAQVGQQLEVMSGGRFLATPHGIVAPGEPGWTRTSIAHFVHLNGRSRVEPLGEGDALQAYAPPVLAGTYATKTLVDIGLAPPSVLGQLGYRHYDRLSGLRALEGGDAS